MVKLNTNENPYPPSPRILELCRNMDWGQLRLYPDPAAKVLTDALAAYHGLLPEQVFAGVGSDDVLAMAFLTFFHSSAPILFPDITYSFYPVWADLFQIPYERPRLAEDFSIVPSDYFGVNGGIIFPNPNAPTGCAMGLEQIREIMDHNRDVVVIVDEAYVDFGAVSALPLLKEYDNLLIVRTYSKSRSMAGMRIGYALGNPRLIGYLNDVKYSFNSYTMSQLTLKLGVASIQDDAYFRETIEKIIGTREHAKQVLKKMGFLFPDSKSNFLFITHPEHRAKDLFEALKEKDIYVRYFALPKIDNYLRVTIGTDAQMETFYEFLRTYKKKGK